MYGFHVNSHAGGNLQHHKSSNLSYLADLKRKGEFKLLNLKYSDRKGKAKKKKRHEVIEVAKSKA